jgi:hypothetical protein
MLKAKGFEGDLSKELLMVAVYSWKDLGQK